MSKAVGSSMAQLLTCAAQGNEHYTGEMTYVAFQHMKHNTSGESIYTEYETCSITTGFTQVGLTSHQPIYPLNFGLRPCLFGRTQTANVAP